MLAEWMHDLESLEAISQDDDTRRLFLRMAALSQDGRLAPLLCALADDDDSDDELKGTLDVIASTSRSCSSCRSTSGARSVLH